MSEFFQIDPATIKILGISIPVVGVLGYFATKYFNYYFAIRTDKDIAFRAASETFRKTFSHSLQQLETGDTTLNLLILGDFPIHDIAMKDFIHNLHGVRKRKFLTKWSEYRHKYYEIKNLGTAGFVAAIAPSTADLQKCTPADMEKWELDRTRALYTLICDLKEIASKN